jgi:hypothetical protein
VLEVDFLWGLIRHRCLAVCRRSLESSFLLNSGKAHHRQGALRPEANRRSPLKWHSMADFLATQSHAGGATDWDDRKNRGAREMLF